jgi:hypothetical protein
MKTVYHYLIVVLALSWSLKSVAQATNGVVANNGYNLNGYLGWNNTSGFNPLLFKTNAINRMKLNGLYTSGSNQYAIDGFTFGATANNINTSGYLLLGPENTNGTFYTTKGAYSALNIQV